ncbi:TLDc domain-containing protein [Oxytricha trifallax]|uniref:TLDc domain-containing protein n=1 Tax=Oxytricha trifallax TaxID=1172189 RepID=A0A073HXC4_9SPIT|nr:TLDc domain-containing protein [Oxytricha trifallax]
MFDNFHQKVAIEVNKKQNSVLKGFLPNWQIANFQLLYKASRDGFDQKIYHQKCDCKGQTLTFLLSKHAKVFGFYISSPRINYINGGNYQDIIIFQLDQQTLHRPINQMRIEINNSSIRVKENNGFGYLGISVNFYLNEIIFSSEQFGNLYEIPHFVDKKDAESYLGGSSPFKVLEMEVYQYI